MPEELSTAHLYQSDDATPQSKLEVSNDRRSSKREVFKQLCFLVINIKGRKVTALVHDISQDGAKVETTCFDLPQRFILDHGINNQRMICKKVWSRDGMTGVRFMPLKQK